jgi:hypothetical protein
VKNKTIYIGPFLKHAKNNEILKKCKKQVDDLWMIDISETETIWISNYTLIGEEYKNLNYLPIRTNIRDNELHDFQIYYEKDIKTIQSYFENIIIEWGLVMFK